MAKKKVMDKGTLDTYVCIGCKSCELVYSCHHRGFLHFTYRGLPPTKSCPPPAIGSLVEITMKGKGKDLINKDHTREAYLEIQE